MAATEPLQELVAWGPLLTLLLVALGTILLWHQRQTVDSAISNQDIRRIWAEQSQQRPKPPTAAQKRKYTTAAAVAAPKAPEVDHRVTDRNIQQQWMQRHQASLGELPRQQQKKPMPKAKPGAEEEAARAEEAADALVQNQTSDESLNGLQQHSSTQLAEHSSVPPSSRLSQLRPETGASPNSSEPSQANPTAITVEEQLRRKQQLRQLRQQQLVHDQAAEFEQALREDQQREAAAEATARREEEEEQCDRDRERAAQLQAAADLATVKLKRCRVPKEPNELKGEGVVLLQIKLARGEPLSRRFRASDSVQAVYDFVDLETNRDRKSADGYDLECTYPRSILLDETTPLQNCQITRGRYMLALVDNECESP